MNELIEEHPYIAYDLVHFRAKKNKNKSTQGFKRVGITNAYSKNKQKRRTKEQKIDSLLLYFHHYRSRTITKHAHLPLIQIM